MSLTVPEALEKLASHGSPRQIADYLAQEGMVGTPQRHTGCIVAEYLKTATSHTWVSVITFQIDSNGATIPDGTAMYFDEEGLQTSAPLPKAVYDLADSFDHHAYPELER